MTARAPQGELPFWRMVMYGLPALPTAFLYVPLPLLIPAFYAEHVGLSLTAVGGFLFLSRLFDMLVDPMLGRLSDRTNTRWGRRRIWMVIGTPIVMLGTAVVFFPPENASGWYLMLGTGIIYFGASMVGLSYSAWGAEIVETYHGRARLAGCRQVAALIGTLMAGIVPIVTASWGHGIDRYTIALLGGISIALMPPMLLLALRFVPEPPLREGAKLEMSWTQSLKTVWTNRSFRTLTAAFVLFSIGSSISTSTLSFYISHYLGQPTMVGTILTVVYISVLASVPLWVRITRKMEKHRVVAFSLLVTIVLLGLIAPFLRQGDGIYFAALCVVLGATSAAGATLPISIMGDVIDYDTLKAGEQRGGLYFGIWAFATQFAPAVGVGSALPFLEWLGFNPAGDSGPEALNALRLVFCFGPLPFYIVGAFLLLRFPITRKRHATIRRRIERRRQIEPAIGAPESMLPI